MILSGTDLNYLIILYNIYQMNEKQKVYQIRQEAKYNLQVFHSENSTTIRLTLKPSHSIQHIYEKAFHHINQITPQHLDFFSGTLQFCQYIRMPGNMRISLENKTISIVKVRRSMDIQHKRIIGTVQLNYIRSQQFSTKEIIGRMMEGCSKQAELKPFQVKVYLKGILSLLKEERNKNQVEDNQYNAKQESCVLLEKQREEVLFLRKKVQVLEQKIEELSEIQEQQQQTIKSLKQYLKQNKTES